MSSQANMAANEVSEPVRLLAARLIATGALDSDASAQAGAIAAGTPDAEALLRLAITVKRLGAPDVTTPLFEEAARLRPDSPSPALFLGSHLLECRRPAEAAAVLEAAAQAFPAEAELLTALGAAYQESGRLNDAIAAFSRQAGRHPEDHGARFNLALALQQAGRLSEAVAVYRQALDGAPDLLPAAINLANCLREQGAADDAIAVLEEARDRHPDEIEPLINLGDLYRLRGRIGDALALLDTALARSPGHPGARLNRAMALLDHGRLDEALAECDAVAAVAPDHPAVHLDRAAILKAQNRLSEAEAACRRSLDLEPLSVAATVTLGSLLLAQGRVGEAVECFAAAQDLAPDHPFAHSNLIFALDLLPGATAAVQQGERRRWNAIHRAPTAAPAATDPGPDRRLRVGYVSADFRRHSAASVFGLVLENHDPAAVEVVCYSDTGYADDLTARLRQRAALWRDIRGQSDEQVAALVRADAIDILVDLSGHSAGHRLGVFVLKPAPVQVTAWGHANGTGLEAIDALFADPVAIPAAERPLYAETIIDLPGLLCFQPPAECPPVEPLPERGPVFGFLGRAAKLTPATIGLWARLLAAVPDATLVLKDRAYDDGTLAARVRAAFAEIGIAGPRLVLMGGSDRPTHLAAYNAVDVVLDPLPHGGGVTTFEALWMGAPVVGLAGDTLTGRLAAAIVAALGLDSLVAADADAYVEIARRLVADRAALAALRADLRPRLAASPLCDGRRYTAAVEDAYRRLWRAWCADGRAVPPRVPAAAETYVRTAGRRDFPAAYADYAQALELEKKGQLAAAARSLTSALSHAPDYPEAVHQLAALRVAMGDSQGGERLYRALVDRHPDYPRGKAALAAFLQKNGAIEQAEALYQSALADDPDLAEVRLNLASIRAAQARLDEAEELLTRALRIDSSLVDAYIQLAQVQQRRDQPEAAERNFAAAIRHAPENTEALRAYGQFKYARGEYDESLELHRRAAAVVPANPWALLNYASALRRKGKFRDGIDLVQQALALVPDMAEAYYNLGNLQIRLGRTDLSIAAYQRAMELGGETSTMMNNLANALSMAGRQDEARAANRRAIELAPDNPGPYTNAIFYSDFDPDLTTQQQQDLRKAWYERFGRPNRDPRPHANLADPERRLRVGYLSGDFFRHSASQIFSLVVLNHSPGFEVVCYSNGELEDDITEMFVQGVAEFHRIRHLDDVELAQRIRDDRIDVLVDLSAHSGGTRIGVLPRKPAPVQVTAWGHANGTGIPEVDVLLSDPVVIPPAERQYYAEAIADLSCFICLRPPPSPDVAPLPAQSRGYVTIGCLTRISKVSEKSLRLWARILDQLPDSRLLLKDKELDSEDVQADIARRAEAAGIDPARLDLVGWTPHWGHLDAYNGVDIALDPIPYGGGVSTAEALWMGAPVMAMMGHNHVGRLAASVITAAGLGDLIAADEAGYERLAVELGRDLPRLAALRAGLRPRMAAAALTRGDLYTAEVEAVYRRLWRAWCANHGAD